MKGKTVLFVAAVCFFVGATGCTTVVPVRHVIVYKGPGRFWGWPANNGIWQWNDEILVGFKFAY
jgi:hypothetical protein